MILVKIQAFRVVFLDILAISLRVFTIFCVKSVCFVVLAYNVLIISSINYWAYFEIDMFTFVDFKICALLFDALGIFFTLLYWHITQNTILSG